MNPPERTTPQRPFSAKIRPKRRWAALLAVAYCRTYSTVSDSFGGMAVASRRVVVRWWPGWAAVLLLALLPALASAQPARTFEVLGGSTHPDSLRAGTMLTLTEWRISEADTLKLWVERTTRSQGPSLEPAAKADRVIWCYPDRYTDPRHLFPGAQVVLSLSRVKAGRELITFTSEEAYRQHYANELGGKALALH